MITGSVLSISLVSNSSQCCSYRNLPRTVTSQCSDKQSRIECVLAENMACNSGLALCLCGSPGQTDNGFTLRIIAPSISRVSCFKDLINLNKSQVPSGGSCRFEYCQAVNSISVASENGLDPPERCPLGVARLETQVRDRSSSNSFATRCGGRELLIIESALYQLRPVFPHIRDPRGSGCPAR